MNHSCPEQACAKWVSAAEEDPLNVRVRVKTAAFSRNTMSPETGGRKRSVSVMGPLSASRHST